MELYSTYKIGEYKGVPVYYSVDSSKSVCICRGPLNRTDGGGKLVYVNNETGKMTYEDGTPYVHEKVEYVIKFYTVWMLDIEEAIKEIKKEIK
jgi:hypothetical protein